MFKAYNSFIDLIYKVLELIIFPLGTFGITAFFLNVDTILTKADTLEMSYDIRFTVSLAFTLMIVVGAYTITDFFEFSGIYSKKYSGIEYMKSSKNCKKVMMGTIVSQVIIRTFLVVILFAMCATQVIVFSHGYLEVKEIIERTFLFMMMAWGMMSLAVFIVRFTRNQQMFIIVIYFLMQVNMFAMIMIVNRYDSEISQFVLKNTTLFAGIVYGVIGVISNLFIIWRMYALLNKSWFKDEGVMGIAS